MPDRDKLKLAAAEAAMAFLPPSGVIGLGTGSTASHALRLIAQRIAEQRDACPVTSPSSGSTGPFSASPHPPTPAQGLVAVATSRASALAAAEAGIPLLDETGPWDVAVTFDGADEVGPELDLIKGGGGALLREKIVNRATALNVIMVDDAKLSDVLGSRFALPVEVARFGWEQTCRAVESLAGPATLRQRGGAPFVTDNGNYILDVATGPIVDPAALECALETLPGVVVTGLFVGRTDVLVVAGAAGVEIRRKKP